MKPLLFCAAVLGLSPSLVLGSTWQPIGPGGGTIADLAVSASNDDRVYASGPNGLFRSDDLALSWTDISVGLPARGNAVVGVAPSDADVIYAGIAGHLYRSRDAGQTWTAARPGPSTAMDQARQLVVAPGNADQLLGAFKDGLYWTGDGGNHWSRINESPFHSFDTFAVFSGNPDILLAGGQRDETSNPQAFRSVDGGQSWEVVGVSGDFDNDELVDRNLAFFPAGESGSAIALSDGNVYRTGNWGDVWESLSATFSSITAETVVIDPQDPTTWLVGGRNGILWTGNNGDSAADVGTGLGPPGAQGSQAAVLDLVLTPDGQNLYAGTEHAGLWWGASSQGGVFTGAEIDWDRPNLNAGLRQAAIGALAVNPADGKFVYAAYHKDLLPAQPSDLLWKTTDAGASWRLVDDGIEASQLAALAIDPLTVDDPSTMFLYAVGWGHARFPNGSDTTGVFASDDGGSAWGTRGSGSGLPRGGSVPKYSVVLDPTSAAQNPFGGGELLSTLYVAGAGRMDLNSCDFFEGERIFKSIDSGQTWSAASAGLPIPPCFYESHAAYEQDVRTLAMDPANPATLYAGLAIEVPEALANDPVDGTNGVFKTTDGGSNWVHMSSGLPRLDPNDQTSPHWDVLALATGQTSSGQKVVYAVVQPVSRATLSPGVQESRVYRSDDGGESWNMVSNRLPGDTDLRVLLVDPEDANRVFVAGRGTPSNPGSVYLSKNGGQSWSALAVGLNSQSVHALALDKAGAVLYAGTSGGVYRLEQVPDSDSDGVPNSVEANAPNGGDGNGDGADDQLQSSVSSLVHVGPGRQRGANTYMTIEILGAPRGDRSRGTAAECEWFWNAQAVNDVQFPLDPYWEYPFGMIRFEVPACAAAEIRLVMHAVGEEGFDDHWQFRVFAPDEPGNIETVRWQKLPGSSSEGNAWIIQLADGELGDMSTSNGTIRVQGGAARSTEPVVFADRFEDVAKW